MSFKYDAAVLVPVRLGSNPVGVVVATVEDSGTKTVKFLEGVNGTAEAIGKQLRKIQKNAAITLVLDEELEDEDEKDAYHRAFIEKYGLESPVGIVSLKRPQTPANPEGNAEAMLSDFLDKFPPDVEIIPLENGKVKVVYHLLFKGEVPQGRVEVEREINLKVALKERPPETLKPYPVLAFFLPLGILLTASVYDELPIWEFIPSFPEYEKEVLEKLVVPPLRGLSEAAGFTESAPPSWELFEIFAFTSWNYKQMAYFHTPKAILLAEMRRVPSAIVYQSLLTMAEKLYEEVERLKEQILSQSRVELAKDFLFTAALLVELGRTVPNALTIRDDTVVEAITEQFHHFAEQTKQAVAEYEREYMLTETLEDIYINEFTKRFFSAKIGDIVKSLGLDTVRSRRGDIAYHYGVVGLGAASRFVSLKAAFTDKTAEFAVDPLKLRKLLFGFAGWLKERELDAGEENMARLFEREFTAYMEKRDDKVKDDVMRLLHHQRKLFRELFEGTLTPFDLYA